MRPALATAALIVLTGCRLVGIARVRTEVESITALDEDGEAIETFELLAP